MSAMNANAHHGDERDRERNILRTRPSMASKWYSPLRSHRELKNLEEIRRKSLENVSGWGRGCKNVFLGREFEPQEYIFKQSKLCFFFQKYFNNHFCRRS
jgi:hypothetical protein